MRESKCYISVACFHYGGSDLLRFGKFEVLITSQALLSQKQPIFMQNYNFVKNDVFVAKICKYALYESSEGLFCAPRKAANFCHPVTQWDDRIVKECLLLGSEQLLGFLTWIGRCFKNTGSHLSQLAFLCISNTSFTHFIEIVQVR